MTWTGRDIGIAMGTRAILSFGFIPTLIVVGVVFAVFAVAVFLLGLVSAIIYMLAGLGIFTVCNAAGLFGQHGILKVLAMIGFAGVGFLVGYGADHIQGLQLMSFTGYLSGGTAANISGLSFQSDATQFFVTYAQLFGGILIGAAVVGILALLLTKKKPKKGKKS